MQLRLHSHSQKIVYTYNVIASFGTKLSNPLPLHNFSKSRAFKTGINRVRVCKEFQLLYRFILLYGHSIISIPLHHFSGLHMPWGLSENLETPHLDHITCCSKECVSRVLQIFIKISSCRAM
jgi:hypothetical protein